MCHPGGLALGLLWFSSGRGNGRSFVRFFKIPGSLYKLRHSGSFSAELLLVGKGPFHLRGAKDLESRGATFDEPPSPLP